MLEEKKKEEEQRRQEMLAERNKPLATRLNEAAPRFLEALKQRLFSTLFLVFSIIVAFSPVLCVLGAFGGVSLFVTAGMLAIQTLSILVFLMPLFLFALVAFVGIFSVAMAIMVTIKCINAIIQSFIQAFLRVWNTFRECIYQVQVWYMKACRLGLEIYHNIVCVIFFPFVLAEFIRCLFVDAIYTVFINPVSWFVSLPFIMVNGVMEAIVIVLGAQRTTRSRPSSRRGCYRDVLQPQVYVSSQHHQPMNGKLHRLPTIACFNLLQLLIGICI